MSNEENPRVVHEDLAFRIRTTRGLVRFHLPMPLACGVVAMVVAQMGIQAVGLFWSLGIGLGTALILGLAYTWSVGRLSRMLVEESKGIATLAAERLRYQDTLYEVKKYLDRGKVNTARTLVAHALDPDPWLHEPLTEEERRAVEAVTPHDAPWGSAEEDEERSADERK